jgi:hypothetical protein
LSKIPHCDGRTDYLSNKRFSNLPKKGEGGSGLGRKPVKTWAAKTCGFAEYTNIIMPSRTGGHNRHQFMGNF